MTVRLTALLLLLAAIATDAQTQFEAVAIKPARPEGRPSSGIEGSQLTLTSQPLFFLIQQAYDITDPDLIAGAEPWMKNTAFDIRARAASRLSYPSVRDAIRQMLEERFNLKTHHEQRLTNVYVARLVRPDGQPGPWLRPTAPDCVRAWAERTELPPSCEQLLRQREAERAPGAWTLLRLPVPMLFATFRQVGGFDRPIVDRTGLTGPYDMSVRFQVDRAVDATPGAVPLVTAVRDQLGIKFDVAREPMDILVIDRAMPPTID